MGLHYRVARQQNINRSYHHLEHRSEGRGWTRGVDPRDGTLSVHWGVLGWDEGKFCHVEGDKVCNPGAFASLDFSFGDPSDHSTPWPDKKEQPFGQSDTIGLQFDTATGCLTV